MKQWQHPPGQLHSEHRFRQLFTQQNHSPDVVQLFLQPPPFSQDLQPSPMLPQDGCGEEQGLHGNPLHEAQASTSPRETPLRVRVSPAPRELAPMNRKKPRLEDFLPRYSVTPEVTPLMPNLRQAR